MAKKYLLTGGAGFIGVNYAARLIERGESVLLCDNLSRRGAKKNLKWLQDAYPPGAFQFIEEDVRNFSALTKAVTGVDIVVHLAAQVAVTTSVANPREDFEINALGTLNVLEAARLSGRNPLVIYSSTNKVYGGMESLGIVERATRYECPELPHGVPEQQQLDFHSPYGCSKGAADQYVRDYYRIYGMPTVVMRQSCIYGTHQFGIEDQGWVAWFAIRAIGGSPITIYGDGKQVRDLLYIDDLLDAFDAVAENITLARGQVYNIGGGPDYSISVWLEFSEILQEILGRHIPATFSAFRPGDQRTYISDIRKFSRDFSWRPKVTLKEGVNKLCDWIEENRVLFASPD